MNPSLQIFGQLGLLLVIDVILVAVLGLLLLPLARLRPPAFAVLKRNFVGYFSNPTGYMFLSVFVFVTTLVAFVPPQFFAANLGNLDQLNQWLPLILLFYIPTITMSIWSEERRQGTDELLLTLPADDFDIVVGKYLAAAAVFTAALLFSQLSNLAVLVSLTLGNIDIGLLFTTYLGYWLMGLAMLSLGMVASFLTRNLTVGFILGVLINAPLVALGYANYGIASDVWAQRLRTWSMSASLEDFGRGVVSVSGLIYYGMLIVVGIYLSMVLIGRRHWVGGRDGHSMLGHYLVRGAAILVIAGSLTAITLARDFGRVDNTKGNVSSLSSQTAKMVRELDSSQPVHIEAYISSNIPEQYLQTRHDLLSMLKALQSIGGSKLDVVIHDNIEPFSAEAQRAEQRYGIRPQAVNVQSRGTFRDESIIMAAAFTRGMEKVIVPFFDAGVPIEYELVRSIATVAQPKRRTLGVLQTDAQMLGGMAPGNPFSPGRSIQKRAIITELEQQYKVEEVPASAPIDVSKYDVLLAVQPSLLSPQQLPHLIAAIKAGLPTAIFEDPHAVFLGVPGTGAPKQPPMAAMMGQPPEPKCDIGLLWDELGIQVAGQKEAGGFAGSSFMPDIVWQQYNPYPQLGFQSIGPEFVFISDTIKPGFSADDPVTSGLQEVLYPFSSAVKRVSGTGLEYEAMVTTDGKISGTTSAREWQGPLADPRRIRRGDPTGDKTLVARIKGKTKTADSVETEKKAADGPTTSRPKDAGLHVIYVTDADVLADAFVSLRNQPDQQLEFRFDNVPFVLNVIDSLAGDDRFLEIRKRKLRYSTLKLVEEETKSIRANETARRDELQKELEAAIRDVEEKANAEYTALQAKQKEFQAKRDRGEQVEISISEAMQMDQDLKTMILRANERLGRERRRLEARRDAEMERTRREYGQRLQGIQNQYKTWAVLLPPIPPLLIGLVVFARRRLREREGIARNRLK